jgi:hypothetical protein
MSRLTYFSGRGAARRIQGTIGGIALALALCFPLTANAQGTTVLTFDFGPNAGISNGTLIPQDYGDNVVAASMGAYSYGGSAPFTPNVTTLYSGGTTGPRFWDTGYGNLTNVAFGEENQLLLITFSPAAGTMVTLNSFDLAGWPGSDYVINSVQVFGSGASEPLFRQTDVLVRGDSSPQHTSFTFDNTISATGFLVIQIDALNLGNQSDNIGIDNISFTQTNVVSAAAPEPGALSLLGAVLLPIGCLARRRLKIG